jgi:hypothetical protein
MWDVQKNPPTDKYLEMFLVDYPFEVELFVPPIFAIVTVPNRPVERSLLEQRMFNIVQNSETAFDYFQQSSPYKTFWLPSGLNLIHHPWLTRQRS